MPSHLLAADRVQGAARQQKIDNGVDISGCDGSVTSLNVLDCHLDRTAHQRSMCLWTEVNLLLGLESQRHGVLHLIARLPERGSLVICAHVEIILADVHTTNDVQSSLVDAKPSLAIMAVQTFAARAARVVDKKVKNDDLHDASDGHLAVKLAGISSRINQDKTKMSSGLTPRGRDRTSRANNPGSNIWNKKPSSPKFEPHIIKFYETRKHVFKSAITRGATHQIEESQVQYRTTETRK